MSVTFGQRFKMLRLEKGLKQHEMIEEFNSKYHYNFTKAAVSQYENDKRIPEIDALKAFAEYFDVSVDYLLGMAKDRTSNTTPSPQVNIEPKKIEPELTGKDRKDIAKTLENMLNNIESVDGLEFYNQPQDEDDMEFIKRGLQRFLEDVKIYNKVKYNPNKNKKKD